MAFIPDEEIGLAAKLRAALAKPALGLKRAVQFTAVVPGVLMVVVAPLVLIAEIVRWLQSGEWPGWSLGDALDFARIGTPRVTWVGLQSIFDLVMSIPGSVGLFTAGLAMVLAVTKSWDKELAANRAADQADP